MLPVPYSRDGKHINAPLHPMPVPLGELLAYAAEGIPIFGGMLPSSGLPGCICTDYFTERMQIRNAVPSAEGALMIALEQMPVHCTAARRSSSVTDASESCLPTDCALSEQTSPYSHARKATALLPKHFHIKRRRSARWLSVLQKPT